ncbi:flagellar brake protein [Stutzerimonas kirkiae]|uniref:Pilus assembly protein PilZ n=1 Tax=Stutzerimonas kirkiae TaxID=2211392 RepID=A0A4Q9R869_9GAMM|nr:flagellar brake protein [Stutzerimonas kirkiae]TBU96805.1 pilus assembly protein PilZ [Stutzerimonas kirkiae]TBV01045.1 pilus assembly protein PilZ [Stutzerimonas kirkiae]TBV08393.1 pilus assembly protein PilZ [Stutzerimonas kirkiae]TBV16664.1 pilus assembly protein PilZ [Stutzerimonas kirkiae]
MSNSFFDEQGPQPPKVLSTPLEIYTHLRSLLENRSPLLIRFAKRATRYQSFLIEINREKGWMALDELIPTDAQALIESGESFHVESQLDGVRITWESHPPFYKAELQNAPCYWVATPREITYHQRRNAYRAQLIGTSNAKAALSGKPLSIILEGSLLDMSATGCKLSIKGDVRERLQPGQVYDQLVAQLPFGRVETAVELRHVIYDEKLEVTFCGLRFHQISGLLQRQIERFVYQLQRESRRDME